MSPAKRQPVQAVAQDVAPAPVQTTPPVGMGHPEYHFVQAIMELQKSLGDTNTSMHKALGELNASMHKELGELNASTQKSLAELSVSIQTINKTVDSTKSKVDDLVKWKTMILGGAIVVGVVISGAIALGTKLSSFVTFHMPAEQAQASSTPAPAQHETPPPTTDFKKQHAK